ncbi:prolyl oligopeptidase family serine peptidase [Catellatospora citrea]|uniref:prolyl oligopeptidase n=1 Tax=Catellatospora citrea TaxID=53366 RepID=A0A8J3KP40_9ACTN|nr:prolyl oligopeptidase family serine peptidase [Catellatospora citrea]RKE11672.1 prolyl oligopeptidase [Catellatospora citrea]GIG02189.1 prolyl endopeptidase [Catellatospora citrea]
MSTDRAPSAYPPAARLNLVEQLHGHRIADPYRWLEDPADPDTAAWSRAQDELLAEHRAGWSDRAALRERLAQLLAVGAVTAPVWYGEHGFFQRRAAEQDHAVLLVIEPDGTERVLLDPNAVDPTGATTLDWYYPSPEGTLLAYALSVGGTEEPLLRVMEVATGDVVDGPIDRLRHTAIAWLPGGEAFYYSRFLAPGTVEGDDPKLHRRVYLHRLGTDPEADPLILGDGSPRGRYFMPRVSRDGRWLTISETQGTDPRNDLWLADLSASPPEAPALRAVQQGVDAMTYPHFHGDLVYLQTNRDAPRWRLCVADPADPAYANWRELIAEDAGAVLDDYEILDGPALESPVLLVATTRHALSELTVHELHTGEEVAKVALPGVGSLGPLTSRRDGGHEAWFSYGDHTTPGTVHRFDARDNTVALWARPPGAVVVGDVVTEQVTYTSPDGTDVRMFVVAPAAAATGPRPTLLYGYGGFNISLTPWYSPMAIAWAEAGGVWAVANLRGGGEEGEQWHRDGMLAHKQNVFDDFHAAADWLVASGTTTPAQLAIMGGSNGGLLVGAALTQRPHAYAAVVCSAPLLDMVRYELFGLGSTWAGEYGTAADPEQLGWLLSYSPYHHVHEGAEYPAVLFTVFDGDSRVDPLHARKLAATLQHATSSTRPVLLRREGDVGHGNRSVSRTLDLYADELAFLTAYTRRA